MRITELMQFYALLFYPAVGIYGLVKITCSMPIISTLALIVFMTSLMTLFYLNYGHIGLIVGTTGLILFPLLVSLTACLVTKTRFNLKYARNSYKALIR